MSDDALIDRAVKILRAGGLVAFPTETVYGLGADATNPLAVGRIFSAKGRPATNPLIVHVASADVAKRFAMAWPLAAQKLAEKFWPGPLTLVLAKHASIAPQVSAGRSTVGLRAPNHPLALKLLEKFDGALAGPSANRSTKISPTTAAHVQAELGDRVDLILDGGPCAVGIESTVLDLTTNPPTILRPGAITQLQIESVIGPVERFAGNIRVSQSAASPGQHEVHYAPSTPAYRFEFGAIGNLIDWQKRNPHCAIVVIAISSLPADLAGVRQVKMPAVPGEYARKLYAELHAADGQSADAIWIELPPDDADWLAVRDRIRRATTVIGPG